MNIRKVLAGSLAAMAAGATVAFGAFAQTSGLGDYVDNSGSTPVAPWIVIGSGNGNPEYAKDVVGAADIAAGVAGFATKARAIGGAAEVSVSGGVSLSTANQKLYSGDSINNATDTLTSEDLPTILASGTFEDDDGNTYDYDQYIVVGGSVLALSDSGDDLDDPVQLIQIGTSSGAPAYTMRIVFNDDLNFSDTDVDGNEIELFGTPYTISSDSDTDTLVLFGGANKQTLTEGETATVDVGGVSYDVTLLGVSDADTAVVKVNDQSRSIDEGQSRKIAGLDVFVDEVFFLSKESQTSSAKLSFGSSKLTMDDGQEVSVGDTDSVDIDNTLVTFTQGSDGTSVLEIAVAAQDDDEDHVSMDDPFTDPVFGTFKLAFGGGSPTMDQMALFQFDVSGDDTATAKFTDSKGEEATVEFSYDSAPGTAGTTLQLADSDGDLIVVVEGRNATEDDYVLINQDDFSHLLEVTKIDTTTGDGSDGKLELKDVFSGTTYEVNMDETGTNSGVFNGTKVIDGKTYIFWSSDVATDVMAVVWGTGAQGDNDGVNVGNTLSVFPTLVAEDGAEIAFIDDSVDIGTTSIVGSVEMFGIAFTLVNGSQTITGTNIDIEYHNSTGMMEVEGTTTPSVLLLEEEGEDFQGTDTQNAVIVQTAEDSTDGMSIATGSSTPVFTAQINSGYLDTSDNDVDVGADRYGTFVSKNTDSSSQGSADVYYPDNQVIMAVGIGANPVFSVSGESGTVQEAYQIMTPIAKLASEVTSPSTLNRDVILVGGPCANALVATLMEVSTSYPACLDDAADLSGLNTGLIKEYTNAFSSGQKALVVAGITADDTRSLAARVLQGTTSYSA